jgi:pyruvate kinase
MEAARTRIVCTIGPASSSTTVLARMMRAGMDVARLNFSHGSYPDHKLLIKSIRAAAKKTGSIVALLQDLQGPKIRVGALPERGVDLPEGLTVTLSAAVKDYKPGGPIPVAYARLSHDVRAGHRILLDDGYLELEVLRVRGRTVHAVVKVGGKLTSHKGINLPDSKVSVSAFTEKDAQDLVFGVSQGVDWVCLSFVTGPEVLYKVRQLVQKEARKYGFRPPLLMAKVERKAALDRLDEIIEAADGIMLGRGDLGVEVPFEDVPVIQKDVVERCRLASKPVIVATQMLESMRTNPRATRAEVSDVANAVFDHADAVMLSAESATGRYPATTVLAMAAVIKEAEASRFDQLPENTQVINCLPSALAHTVSVMARRDLIQAVVTTSSLGPDIAFLNMFRMDIPVLVAVPDAAAARQVILHAGFMPMIADDHAGTFIPRMQNELRRHLKLKSGQKVAFVLPAIKNGVALSVLPV